MHYSFRPEKSSSKQYVRKINIYYIKRKANLNKKTISIDLRLPINKKYYQSRPFLLQTADTRTEDHKTQGYATYMFYAAATVWCTSITAQPPQVLFVVLQLLSNQTPCHRKAPSHLHILHN